jgi:hypothetical protein
LAQAGGTVTPNAGYSPAPTGFTHTNDEENERRFCVVRRARTAGLCHLTPHRR